MRGLWFGTHRPYGLLRVSVGLVHRAAGVEPRAAAAGQLAADGVGEVEISVAVRVDAERDRADVFRCGVEIFAVGADADDLALVLGDDDAAAIKSDGLAPAEVLAAVDHVVTVSHFFNPFRPKACPMWVGGSRLILPVLYNNV